MKYYSLGNCAFNTKPMWRNLFTKRLVPLTGAPSVRRLKTYSAQSGYVYQYFYEGQRPWQDGKEHGTEFVFTVSADRKTTHELSVIVAKVEAVGPDGLHDDAVAYELDARFDDVLHALRHQRALPGGDEEERQRDEGRREVEDRRLVDAGDDVLPLDDLADRREFERQYVH